MVHTRNPGKLIPILTILLATVVASAENYESAQGHRLAPDSGLTFEEEYKMFEMEESLAGQSDHIRKKRFIYLNVS